VDSFLVTEISKDPEQIQTLPEDVFAYFPQLKNLKKSLGVDFGFFD
jgi:ABC-type branched-subunit amino acid transport system ATPase component